MLRPRAVHAGSQPLEDTREQVAAVSGSAPAPAISNPADLVQENSKSLEHRRSDVKSLEDTIKESIKRSGKNAVNYIPRQSFLDPHTERSSHDSYVSVAAR